MFKKKIYMELSSCNIFLLLLQKCLIIHTTWPKHITDDKKIY